MEPEKILPSLDLISYGLYVVTSHADGKANGLIANTVMQVALEPPRVSVCLHKNTLTHEMVMQSGLFGVSVLSESAPLSLFHQLGYQSGRQTDKLSLLKCITGAAGCLLVTDSALSVFEARVFDRMIVGSHTIFAADVLEAHVLSTGKPMTYAFYRETKKGRSSANSPTFRPIAESGPATDRHSEASTGKQVCSVCGYVYDPAAGDPEQGIAPGTSFAELPSTWTCPVCGVGKEQFSPV